MSSLADVTREQFDFVDTDRDGLITSEELATLNKSIAQEEGVSLVGNDQLSFSLQLWDLNGDGRVTTEEMLRSIALDRAVGDDAIDADVVRVFDADGSGAVDAAEFSRGLGDLGAEGEGMKRFVFRRSTDLAGSSRAALSVDSAFPAALVVARTAILGY